MYEEIKKLILITSLLKNNNLDCTTCNLGYFMNSSSSCEDCSTRIAGCVTCNNENSCTSCSDVKKNTSTRKLIKTLLIII